VYAMGIMVSFIKMRQYWVKIHEDVYAAALLLLLLNLRKKYPIQKRPFFVWRKDQIIMAKRPL